MAIERRFAKLGIHCRMIAEDGIDGFLCDQGDGRQHPGVMVLGGSEGGVGLPDVAVLLASHGFTTLSLAYFGFKGLPPTLQNIPVEYFGRALEWMRACPETDPTFVACLRRIAWCGSGFAVAATYPRGNGRCRAISEQCSMGRRHSKATSGRTSLDLSRQAADRTFPSASLCGLQGNMCGILSWEIRCGRCRCSCTIGKPSVILAVSKFR